MKKTTISKNDCWLFEKSVVLCCIALLFLNFWPMYKSSYTFYTPDSVGYFGIAATVCGNDWKSILANISTYSYGYALFLIPVIYFFQGTKYILVATAVINSLLLCGIFLCTLFCTLNFLKNKWWSLCVAVVFSCYSGYISAAQNYIADILVIFLFWAIIVFLIKFIEKQTVVRTIALAFLSVFIYASHQRAIAVVAAIIIVVFTLFIRKNILRKYGYLLAVLIGIMFIGAKWGYNRTSALFASALEFDGNSASMRLTWFFQETFTLAGIWRIIRNFFGQVYYCFVSTLGLFPTGIVVACIVLIKEILPESKEKLFFSKKGIIADSVILLIVLSFFMELGIICVSVNVQYIVHLMFGRYIEFLAMPSALVLLAVLDKKLVSKKSISCIYLSLSCLVVFGGGLISYLSAKLEDQSKVSQYSAIGTAWIGELNLDWCFGGIISVLAGGILIYYLMVNNRKRYVMVGILLLYFILSIEIPYKNSIRSEWQRYENDIQDITLFINEKDIELVYWPYYSNSEVMKRLQVLLPDVSFNLYDASVEQMYASNANQMMTLKEILNKNTNKSILVIPYNEFKMVGISELDLQEYDKNIYTSFNSIGLWKNQK